VQGNTGGDHPIRTSWRRASTRALFLHRGTQRSRWWRVRFFEEVRSVVYTT
jgi:hypothetical protein